MHVAQLFCSQLQNNQVAQLPRQTMSQEIKRITTHLGGELELLVAQLQREEEIMPETDEELRNLVLQLLDNIPTRSDVAQELSQMITGDKHILPSQLIAIIVGQLQKVYCIL